MKGGGHFCRLPSKLPGFARLSPRVCWQLCGFAGALGFQRLLAADVDLDLLGLGFRLLGQLDLQHALVVVGRNILRVHRVRQSERAGEAAILRSTRR